MTIQWVLVLGFAMSGAVTTQFLTYRFLPVSEIFRWGNWGSPWIAGALAGALFGHALWVVAKPRQRTSRTAAMCAVANVFVWLSFLTFTPPLDNAEFSRINKERLHRDANHGGLHWVTDQPIVVAARWHGTFGAVNSGDCLLSLFAGPAIGFAELLVVPSRYIGIDATKRESLAIAGLGFVLSSGFWVGFGNLVSALARPFRRRAAKPATKAI
jgi:hypothetical protein